VSRCAARRDAPHSDVVSLLATGEIDGAELTDAEVVLNCYSLILGGDETTRLTMSGGVLALLRHPEQCCALREGSVPLETPNQLSQMLCVPPAGFEPATKSLEVTPA